MSENINGSNDSTKSSVLDNDPAPDYEFYQQYKISGRLFELRDLCERELSRRPENVEARIFLAIALYELGLGSNAISLLRSSIREIPYRVDLRGNLATMLELDGQWEEAFTIATDILHDQPEHYWMYPVVFRLAIKMHRFSHAIEIIRGGIESCEEIYRVSLEEMLAELVSKAQRISVLPSSGIADIPVGDYDPTSQFKSDEQVLAFYAETWKRYNGGERNLRVIGALKSLSWHPLVIDEQFQLFAFRARYNFDPTNNSFMLALANNHLKRKHFHDTISIIQRYEIENKKTGEAALTKCRAYCALQDFVGEVKCMEDAVEYLPPSDPIRSLLELRLSNYSARYGKKKFVGADTKPRSISWPAWKHGVQRRTIRPKLALCATGQMRDFRDSFASWGPLLDAFDTDLYIHTWKSSAKLQSDADKLETLYRIPAIQANFTRESLSAHPFTHSIASLDNITNDPNVLKSFYGAKQVVIDDEKEFERSLKTWWASKSSRPLPPPNQAKLWQKVHACNRLIERDKYGDYDYVMRIRLDFCMQKWDFNELLELSRDRSAVVGLYLLGAEYVGFDDCTWFGSPEAIENSASVWKNVLENFGADYLPSAPNTYAESVCFYQNFAAGAKMLIARQNRGYIARHPDVFEEQIAEPLLKDLAGIGSEQSEMARSQLISTIAARRPAGQLQDL